MANLNPIFRKSDAPIALDLPFQGNAGTFSIKKVTAGDLMKNEYAAIRPNLAAADAIKTLHRMADRQAEKLGSLACVFVTDEEQHLLGACALSDLIFAHPGTLVRDFMHREVASLKSDDDQERVARMVVEYDLPAVPVVDDQNRLLGIVTADDALESVIPPDWKRRLPRFYR